MNLPFIIDVALGLIFIYLILSLLASEIQELIAALLQWRAKHLQESITNLLQGGEKLPNRDEQDAVKELVKKIYDDPLIRNINQSSVEGIASFFRWITWVLPDFYNWVIRFVKKDLQRTFGDQKSAPSYIPAETFATTLLESIGISYLSRLLIQRRFEKFNKRLVTVIESTLKDVFNKPGDARERVNKFDEELQQIVEYYENSESTLQTSIFRVIESFDRLIAFFENYPSITPADKSELQAIKTNYFGEKGERAFLFGLSPSPSELMELIDKGSRVYKEIEPVFLVISSINPNFQACAQKVEQEIASLAKKQSITELTEEDRNQFASIAMMNLKLSDSDRKTYKVYRTSQAITQKVEQEIANRAKKTSSAELTQEDRDQFASIAMVHLKLSDSDRKIYKVYRTSQIAQKVEQEIARLANRPSITQLTQEDRDQHASDAMDSLNLSDSDRKTYEIYRTYKKIDQVINELPKYVRDSLKVLARRAESRIQQVGTQVQQVGDEIAHLRTEVEFWFDRSMDRASGVYKRNAKGFAILLGFVLAAATNSDTFHVFSRISNDEKLRQVIVQNATIISQNPNLQQGDLNKIREQTDKALKVIPLPIGWNPTIIKQQLNCSDPDTQQANNTQLKQPDNEWNSIAKCNSKSFLNPFGVPGKIIGMMLASFFWNGAIMLAGWLVSGIAIAMGAPFWFDLLSKVVNVRNTGKPPTSSTTGQTTSSSQPNAPGS